MIHATAATARRILFEPGGGCGSPDDCGSSDRSRFYHYFIIILYDSSACRQQAGGFLNGGETLHYNNVERRFLTLGFRFYGLAYKCRLLSLGALMRAVPKGAL